MPVKFIGYIGYNNESEIHGLQQYHPLDRDHVEAVAKAQEEGGFDRVLVPYGSNSPDSLIIAGHAAAITTQLGFVIAHRPGFTQPTVAARQLASLDRLSGGRVAVHIVSGGPDIDMARDGDNSQKSQRYARADEYLTVLRQEWTAETPFDHDGEFYRIRGGFASVKPGNLPVFFGGSSPEAIEVAGRHADVYAMWGETLSQVREVVTTVRAATRRHARPDPGFSLSLRPIIADTEEAAWKRADEVVEMARDLREQAGLLTSGHTTAISGALRLQDTVQAGYRADKRLWTGLAAVTGIGGNMTGLVGTPEQVADAMVDYYALGIDHFLIRGFDPLNDAIGYGRELLPMVHERVARFDAEHGTRRAVA